MKRVEIITSNHVAIEYELASPGHRIFALMIDIIVLVVYVLIVGNVLSEANSYSMAMVLSLLISIPFIFYSLICESLFNGQTLGKFALRIRVISMDGKNPGFGASSIRWVFRIVDIWGTGGAMALILASSTDRSQRVGDLLANTAVISLAPKTTYNIQDVLSIKDNKDYTATYPTVTRFTDEDMLLIKNTLDRAKQYPNSNHKAFVQSVADKVKQLLKLDQIKQDDAAFLKTILQDYIVLTRS